MVNLLEQLGDAVAELDRCKKRVEELKMQMEVDESDRVTLDDLIGNMDHLKCETSSVTIRGLEVVYWKYWNPSEPLGKRDTVVALHGGPAACHNYILPLKLLAHMGYPVVF